MPAKPETVVVYAIPLPSNQFVEGVGAEGTELPAEKARQLLDAGLVTDKKPSKPAEPAPTDKE